LNRGLRGFH